MKCFYHNDLDGRCAGSLVSIFTSNHDEKDFFEIDYVNIINIDTINDNEDVYIVDYSFTENTLDALLEINRRCNLIWIDHHTSSIILQAAHPALNNIKGIRSEKYSGAYLTYQYLFKGNDIPLYVQLVDDYDCWKKKLDGSDYFDIGIDLYDNNALDTIWEDLYLCRISEADIIDKGKTIKQYIDNNNTYYREHYAYESVIGGYKALVVNKKSGHSIFGKEFNNYPVVCVWVFDGSTYVYSVFSSNKDVDCRKIAETYGGGGHKGAAGFQSSILLFTEIKKD